MQKHRNILVLLLIVLSLTVLSTLTALSSQKQNSTASPTQQSAEAEQEPIADYAAGEPADPEKRAKRRARGKRYDGQSWVMEPHPQSGGGDVGRLDSSVMLELPAFPTEISHAVVIGETTEAQAYLSNDKSGVYTEFTVSVEDILKQDTATPLVVGETLAAQRAGGRVRFPSGRVQRYKTHYQHLPRAGGRYVLFLKRNDDGQSYYILTGYELRAGRVHPVDGVNMNKGASELPQFAAYKDADEAAFLSAVRAAVAKSLPATPE